ncbi:MAG: universal stress protein [Alphaproteobacteria bacterium]|nr:universal stress protein [Alphaproteobacteria bacterium]
MTIKSILCIFNGSQDELNALNTAYVLGKTYGAEIRVLHISPDPASFASTYSEGIILNSPFIKSIEKENTEHMHKAKQYVSSFAVKHNLPFDKKEIPMHHASIRFQHLIGMGDFIVAHEGRLSDLIVIGHKSASLYDLLSPALFDTGRPVFILPAEPHNLTNEFKDKIVAFAWNGSLQAARAIYNALPLLHRVEKFYIIKVEKRNSELSDETNLMSYLKTHGISTESILIPAGKYQNTGEAIATKTKELNADLLIMGAYGHSVFREMILGGVTQYMLKNIQLPILLSH